MVLALLSLVVGIAAGFIGILFHLTLDHVEHLRAALVARAHTDGVFGGMLFVALCAVAISLTVWCVSRLAPQASGSGIPHVEAVLNGIAPPARIILVPIKFIGGTLAIGSGLALGREGPSVQMGASIAYWIGQQCKRSDVDCRVLLAAGAGAGLATAFNAPLAGALFVLEELMRKFETRTAIAALGASVTAICVARLFLGNRLDFHVEGVAALDTAAILLCILLGALAGIVGVLYNRIILASMALMNRCERYHPALRGALAGIVIGVLALFFPHLVGDGGTLTQSVLSPPASLALSLIPLYFLFRFVLGAFSYSVGTPGGLFAPMLTLGAFLGIMFVSVCEPVFPEANLHYQAAAIIGMAAFFTAVVRAPLTGMILVVEMTGVSTLLLPLLGACFAAMVVPTLLGNSPIYESLSHTRNPGQK